MINTAPRVVERMVYGRTYQHRITPEAFTCSGLAAGLADYWTLLSPELPGSTLVIQGAIHDICRLLDGILEPTAAATLTVSALKRTHLDRWELDLLRRQREDRSDNRYRCAVFLFALLRRIEDDTPGTLDPSVAQRVRAQTRLHHIRRPGPAEFSTWERRRIIRAAKVIATDALRASQEPSFGGPSRDAIIALAVLLGFGTGEPPEVLRGLHISDITPLQNDPTDERSVDEIATCEGADAYLVRYTKRRAGTVYEDVIRRPQRLAYWSLNTLISVTASSRQQFGTNVLWLWGSQRKHSRPTGEVPWTKGWSLRNWVGRHITGPTDDLNPPITEPINYARLRKTLIAREAVDNPARYLRTDRRHSSETFFAHYAASPILRAHAGKILIEAVEELFEHAIAGPLIVVPDAEEALNAGASTPALIGIDVAGLLQGELDGPLAACRNPLDSPHAPTGSPCPSYANGQCFSCPNAIITSRHLPAVLHIVDILRPERFGRVDAWRTLWEPTYKFLTEIVLPQFPAAAIDTARGLSETVYVDAGLLQTLGGADGTN